MFFLKSFLVNICLFIVVHYKTIVVVHKSIRANIFYISLSSFLFVISAQAKVTKRDINSKSLQSSQIIPGSPILAYKHQMNNGLTLIIVPDSRNPLATIHFILDAGSNREEKGTTGLAHFFEHMMFRKTIDSPEGNFDQVLNSIGGTGNAGTSESFVTFYSTFPAPALETMLKLEADRFIRLDLAEPYFSTEKGAVISERKLRVENDPMQRSNEIIRSITERNTPMEWMTIGSKDDVTNMSIEAAKSFYNKYYTPNNVTLIIGGPFETKNVVSLVDKYFSSWIGAEPPAHPKLPLDYFKRDLGKKFICGAPVFTKQFKFIYPNESEDLKSIVYSYIFQALLDDNIQGTFERRLVKAKLATDFNFYKVFWQEQSNPFVVNFSLSKEQKIEPLIAFWQQGIEEVLKKNLSDKIKNQVLKQLAVSNAEATERMTSLVNTILENTFFLDDFNASGKAEKLVQSVTTDSFRQWVRSNLMGQKFYTTGIVPADEAPSCPDLYKEFQNEVVKEKGKNINGKI